MAGTVETSPATSPDPVHYLLVRILGNDLSPRHRPGQTRENLEFTLTHETAFPDCQKLWLVNRIIDPGVEQELISLLKRHAQEFLVIPFGVTNYAHHGSQDEKLCQLINLNQARNLALAEGRKRATWTFPFDGNTYLPDPAWAGITHSLRHLNNKLFRIWMYRVRHDNSEALDFEPAKYRKQEPQIIVHRSHPAAFDETVPYGRDDKIELLKRFPFTPNLDYVVRLNDFTQGYQDQNRWSGRALAIPQFIAAAEARMAPGFSRHDARHEPN